MDMIVVRALAWLTVVALGLSCSARNPAFNAATSGPTDATSVGEDPPAGGGAGGAGARDASIDAAIAPGSDAAIAPGSDAAPPNMPRDTSTGPIDGPPVGIDAVPIDATDVVAMTPPDLSCVDVCIGASTLRSCSRGDTPCSLGCSPAGGAHCQVIAPTAGGVTASDLEATGTTAITIGSSTILHSDSGQIDGVRGPGVGTLVNGIGFRVGNGIGVFTFANLIVAANVTLTLVGPNAVALVSSSDITVGGIIDARGTCTGTAAGPGGGAGGAVFMPGAGPGAGTGGKGSHDNASGGSGAGFGAPGGKGGASSGQPSPAGGGTYPLVKLSGGSGGGGGGGPQGGPGGGGGGAIQLAAKGRVTINGGGGINAGGCGGRAAPNDGGSGGGSGGAIVIDAPTIVVAARGALAVNGGGGGGSDSSSKDGVSGQLAEVRSAGGSGSAAPGGHGGASITLSGDPGGNAKNGGGGGGGVGRIWLNSATGAATIEAGAVLSPRLDDPATSTVQGKLAVR
jgi:hypothetical protein